MRIYVYTQVGADGCYVIPAERFENLADYTAAIVTGPARMVHVEVWYDSANADGPAPSRPSHVFDYEVGQVGGAI